MSCFICKSDDIAYTDVLGLEWCQKDMADIYFGADHE